VAGSRVFLHDLLVDVKRLQGIAIFSGLSKRELERLSQWTDEISVPAGHELAREGQFAHEFFVIESGNADVLKDGTRIAELGPGDFFGEIGLLDRHVPARVQGDGEGDAFHRRPCSRRDSRTAR
jgi:CRP-like cAMP-binding protein